MSALIQGIHHVTAIAGDTQKNVNFYQGILGLRLVKKTVNFDAPDVYHLYYGDYLGLPGSILTFFPFGESARGGRGAGTVDVTSFSAPLPSLSWWEQRLKKYGIVARTKSPPDSRDAALAFEDHDGLGLEIVFNDRDARSGWDNGRIPPEHSIRGFFGIGIEVAHPEKTISILTSLLDHTIVSETEHVVRLAAKDIPGNYVDISNSANKPRARGGAGTVHHLAFSTENQTSQKAVRERLLATLNPTEIIDRNYFTSIYFREPGGVLFEVATRDPGFSVDEESSSLGQKLKLPAQYEQYRAELEKSLPKILDEQELYP